MPRLRLRRGPGFSFRRIIFPGGIVVKLRKLSKDEIKAKAKKYAPIVQAVVSLSAVSLAAYYAREATRTQDRLDHYLDQDAYGGPTIEITPNVMKDVLNGSTMRLRMFHTEEPNRTIVQMTSRKDGFPPEADEAYAKGTPGEAPRV